MSLAFKKSLSLSLLSMSLVACSPWQIYHKPAIDLPVTWQEGWRPATPQDSVPKGEWWLLFNDAELTRLSQAAIAHNQSLKAAFASVQQARALSRVSQAALYPSLDFAATASRTPAICQSPK